MATDLSSEISAMSIPDRIQLVEQIWNSIVDEQANIPLSDAQRAELDRRMADYESHPDDGDSWENVKQRIRGNR